MKENPSQPEVQWVFLPYTRCLFDISIHSSLGEELMVRPTRQKTKAKRFNYIFSRAKQRQVSGWVMHNKCCSATGQTSTFKSFSHSVRVLKLRVEKVSGRLRAVDESWRLEMCSASCKIFQGVKKKKRVMFAMVPNDKMNRPDDQDKLPLTFFLRFFLNF